MTIIDTHAHLYDLLDAETALRDSAAAGVSDVVALSVDAASAQRHFEFRTCPQVHLAIGLHPGNIKADEVDACFSFFRDVLQKDPHGCVAIGEIGLDFWYKWVRQDDAKKNEQRAAFAAQLGLAREFDLPAVIHCRGAWRECLDMTVAAGVRKAVFHWYSGPVDVLKNILDAGFLISGAVALEYSPDSRRAVECAPLDRILIETDTPVRGTTPKDVWRTLKALCAIKALDEDKALAAVNANARLFFNI